MSNRRNDSSKEEKDVVKDLRKTRIADEKKFGRPSTSKNESLEDAGNAVAGSSTENLPSAMKTEEELKKLKEALEPHMEEINKMLNDLVVQEKRKQILEAGLLEDTKYHGMGLIKMLKETCQYFGKDWQVIRQWTLFKQSEQSWDRISKYIAEYENPDNPQYSHPWARLIDPGYFRDLSCKRNLFLCAIFGVVVAEVQGHPGIWQSVWAQKNAAELDVPKRIGAAMLKTYGPRSKDNKKKGRKH